MPRTLKTVFLMAIGLALPHLALIDESAASDGSTPDFEVLETSKGMLYTKCFVTRVETDGLVIKHDGGMARVSLFEVDSSIQEKYEFDPIAAMAAYKRDQAAERERRKQALHETEKFKAEEARKAAQEELRLMAENEWIPAEGTIIKKTEEGILVNLYRIDMVPTKEISTLGFEREGPPRRKLNKFSAGNVFLRHVGQDRAIGGEWQGFVDPAPFLQPLTLETLSKKTPVHRAVTKR